MKVASVHDGRNYNTIPIFPGEAKHGFYNPPASPTCRLKEIVMEKDSANRRQFILSAGAIAAGLSLAACEHLPPRQDVKEKDEKDEKDEGDEKVTPGEDLMQEHGVLKRILLVYGEAIRRIDAGPGKQDLPPEPVKSAAELVRSFVEDYHEKNEENFLFPRFRQSRKLVDLVDTLYAQHQAGRKVTARIIDLATLPNLRDADKSRELADRMRSFIRMYEVHEAREDTVLFPAFRDMLTKREYDALGEQFEKEEHRHFGADGFDLAVDKIAGIEKQLGIYDLAQFTPRV
jgi:hemerythrin-like domain-containing protein